MSNFWIGHTPNYNMASEVCKYSLEQFGINVNKLVSPNLMSNILGI